MVRDVVGDLDLLCHFVPAGDGGEARPEGRVVDALASSSVVRLERVAGEPVVPPAGLPFGTVGAIVAGLARHIGALQRAELEAVFGSLLLLVRGEVAGGGELVNQLLVLTDSIAEHAAVIAVVVDTPLHINSLAGRICRDGGVAPVVRWLIIVDTDPGIVATWTAAANGGGGDIWPGFDGLSDCALGACVYAGLYTACKRMGTGSRILFIPQNQAGCGWKGWLSIHVQRWT